MRITNVALYSSSLEEPITFSLRRSESQSQYIVRAMVGLDADEIISKFYGSGSYSSIKFYDLSLKSREIVMRISLNPRFNLSETYSDIRDRLYRTISATRMGLVTLHFNSGVTTVATIQGFISKFEVPYFTESPEAQITIRCNDPMFRGINPVRFSPEEIGTTNPISLYDSLSTAPHGFTMKVIFTEHADEFSIQDAPIDFEWRWRIVPSGGFDTNDVLYICSEFGRRNVYMDPAGAPPPIYLMDIVGSNSIWPMIFPGWNDFHIPQLSKIDWQQFEFYPAYWGV